MSLRGLKIPGVLDTSSADLIADFFVPALTESVKYDRGVGYFSSGWLRIAARGMVEFASNGGRARWVTSPILDENDWEALLAGHEARFDPILKDILLRNIDDLSSSLEKDTLSALAWMVADEIITFKLALPHIKLERGEFHDKFGVFTDADGNQVSFNGSYNDSIKGTRNYESIKIFCSWEPLFADWVQDDKRRFERLWNNEDPNVRVLDLSEAVHEQILRLRTIDRPYPTSEWISRHFPSKTIRVEVKDPRTFYLWDHQKKAIEEWEKNNRVGILSMATGSGKTLTALVAATRCPVLSLLLIAVPRNNLVDQWKGELKHSTDLPDPLLIYENAALWQDRLFNKMCAAHSRGWPRPLILIGSMQSLSGQRFRSVLADAGLPERALIIIDEVHNVGAPTYQEILNPAFQWRLGLSATPKRHFDEQGTATITSYFQDVVYIYSMQQALEDGCLTPYAYYVYPAMLSNEEYEEYLRLTQQILSLRNQSHNAAVTLQTNNTIDGDSQEVEQLLFRRARILKKTTAKTSVLSQILHDHPSARSLIYCADNEQLDDVHSILNDQGIVHLKYTSQTPQSQRNAALEALGSGHIPALLAIDCLDEGVDVPAVDAAIVLASSRNDRQFIQRRGRVLRRSPDKKKAKLVDVIVLPPPPVGRDGKWMLKGELARAQQMAELAVNKHEALVQIKSYTESYGVLLAELLSGGDDAR